MSIVKRHIRYLAATTDCVIIPGWGGLIACHRPARIDGGLIMAPCRTMVFNPALTHDDGVLAMSLMRREKISYDAARAEIAAEAAAMRAEYEATGQTSIDRVGTFTRSADGSMIFSADASGVADARYRFLAPVSLPSQATHESVDTDVRILRPARESLGRRILRMAAFVAILLGIAVTLTTPITVDRDAEPDFAGIGGKLFVSTGSSTHATASSAADNDMDKPLHFTIAMPDPALAVAPRSQRPLSTKPDSQARYYLIVASHDSRAKAERWIERRAEKNLGIVHGGNRYRVYAATGATIDEAMALKSDPDFSRRNPDAWVYRRR